MDRRNQENWKKQRKDDGSDKKMAENRNHGRSAQKNKADSQSTSFWI